MLKILGAIMVIGASSGIGYYCSKKLKLHLEALLHMKKMIMLLKGEILYMNSTLEEAFAAVALRISDPMYSDFLLDLSEKLKERSSRLFYDIWCEGVELHLSKSDLWKKDRLDIKALGENLGYLDKQMQEKNLDLYLEQLEEEMAQGKEEFLSKSKLYRSLGIMGGIFIAIVLM